jgi:hypothetical protein
MAMCPYKEGILTAFTNLAGNSGQNAIFWSPDGKNLGGGESVYTGISPITAMCAYKEGVLVGFSNVAGIQNQNAVYLSPDEKALGSNTPIYKGISIVTAICSYQEEVLAGFYTPKSPGQTVRTGKRQPDGRIELGWMNITPCVKIEWVKTSIPGVSLPTLYTSEQRLHVFARIDAPTASQNDLLDCAVAAAGTCLVAAVLASPAACAPAFQAALTACLEEKAGQAVINSVQISVETECIW